MKKILGVNFLHTHPIKEKQLGLDNDHVIVDREDWSKVVYFLRGNGFKIES